jgi:hypothetical protein
VKLRFGSPLKCLVEYKGEKRKLTGFANYPLWYDEEDMGTNLPVFDTKRYGSAGSALLQCFVYVGGLDS